MKILHIDSSILGENSASRRLTAAAVARLLEAEPASGVTYRDLAANSVPQFSAEIAAAAGAPDAPRSESLRRDTDTLATVLDEVLAADVLVIGAPMYNFGIPSQLKSWLDALAVPGKTFRYEATGPVGLLGAKRIIVVSTRGGFYGSDSPAAAMDHQESYLRAFFGFLGVVRLEIVRAEGLKVSPEARTRSLEAGLQQAAHLAVA